MISNALQKGTLIYIYDHIGQPVTSIAIPQRYPEDGLIGFTQQNVFVRKGSLVYAYNESGRICSQPGALFSQPQQMS
jgi:hypothetical protein